jgi:cytochrome c553
MPLALMAGLLALIVTTAAVAQDSEKGRALAERLCARCHLNPSQGEKQGPMGVPGFRAVANRPNQSTQGIVAWLKSAPTMMPNHHLTQDEIYVLASFIMTLRVGQ